MKTGSNENNRKNIFDAIFKIGLLFMSAFKRVAFSARATRQPAKSTGLTRIERGNHRTIEQMVGTLQRIDNGHVLFHSQGIK